jgi:hypothetical protein
MTPKSNCHICSGVNTPRVPLKTQPPASTGGFLAFMGKDFSSKSRIYLFFFSGAP